jgi:hypothetical protein
MMFAPIAESTLKVGADRLGKLRRDDRISIGYTAARLLLGVTPVMRSLLVAIVVALAGCPGAAADKALGNDDGPGGEAGAPSECVSDSDCEPAGLKCCDCPTYARPVSDPAAQACGGVMCPMNSCPDNVRAACSAGQCVLACKALACDMTCASGFAIDANGCEECACATSPGPNGGCTSDGDCVRTRADCCGCTGGGQDTAVLASERASFDASLMCPSNPSCTGVDSCPADLAPACVQGGCQLVSPLPPSACGRSDLPACPSGTTCTLNSDDAATQHGVGVCM